MKAAQYSAYGDLRVISVSSGVPQPVVKPGQILVENYAASINAIDWKVRAGYMQQMAKVTFPVTLGGDFAGKVTALGEGVTGFKVGDEVYGQAIVLNGGTGSIAETVAANAANTAEKPKTLPYAESAALPLAGVSALQAIEDHIGLKNGQNILIHGGAGGIGHIAIQIAKSKGAHVATTVSAKDKEFATSLGADKVLDYKSDQFETLLKGYDAVFDTVGGEVASRSFAVLKKGGVIVSMLGQPDKTLADRYGVTAVGQFTQTNTDRLARLAALVDHGKVKVHVDRVFTLDKVREAFSYQETGHPRGKVVVEIRPL